RATPQAMTALEVTSMPRVCSTGMSPAASEKATESPTTRTFGGRPSSAAARGTGRPGLVVGGVVAGAPAVPDGPSLPGAPGATEDVGAVGAGSAPPPAAPV